MRVLLLVPVFLLSACGGDDNPAPFDPGVAERPEVRCEADIASGAPRGSYFSGSLSSGSRSGFAEGILTEYGEIRIHITDTGGIPTSHFVGDVAARFSGDGELRVEACSGAESCAQFATTGAGIRITESCAGSFGGSFEWGYAAMGYQNGAEFAFDPAAGSAYGFPAMPDAIQGSYAGQLAGEDVVISIDGAGALFFQQAPTGCIANGSASPHGSGGFNVYDVELEISNCAGDFNNLNRPFTGLATLAAGGGPGVRERLVLWLSTPGPTSESGNDPALFVTAERL